MRVYVHCSGNIAVFAHDETHAAAEKVVSEVVEENS